MDPPVYDFNNEKGSIVVPPFQFKNCHHFVCSRCQSSQRRLVRYCIKCETVDELLGGGKPDLKSNSVEIPTSTTDFVIESDDEDELPPNYSLDTSTPRTALVSATSDKQNGIHYLLPHETLQGIAMKYRLEGRLLCTLNALHPSALTTSPHLLHTLPFLLLPPSVEPGAANASPRFSLEEERYRTSIFRLQVLEKIQSHAEAKAYMDAAFLARKEEFESIIKNRERRGEEIGDLSIRIGGELDDARESYCNDRVWEKQQVEKGKGKGVMGSKLRSTGMVESSVRGWGF